MQPNCRQITLALAAFVAAICGAVWVGAGEVQAPMAEAEREPQLASSDADTQLASVAADINALFGNGRSLTLSTEYAMGTRTGRQVQTFRTAFVKAADGKYEQQSNCRTTYSEDGVAVDGRSEDAITRLSVLGGQVVCSSVYRDKNGTERVFGPFQVERLGSGLVFRNLARVAPFDFACTEFFYTRDGKIASIRRFNNGEPPNLWTEDATATAEAAAKEKEKVRAGGQVFFKHAVR